MTIHDELILALTQPNEKGDVPIYRMVGVDHVPFRIEESAFLSQGDRPDFTAPLPPQGITPDIIVRTRTFPVEEWVAIEVETDMDFDFGRSLQQVKKYKGKYGVIVVIPKEYERFVPLYKIEGFTVYLWRAIRIWECMQCGNRTTGEGPVPPKCAIRGCNSREQRLKGIRNAEFTEA